MSNENILHMFQRYIQKSAMYNSAPVDQQPGTGQNEARVSQTGVLNNPAVSQNTPGASTGAKPVTNTSKPLQQIKF
jgi:hypothetical protein